MFLNIINISVKYNLKHKKENLSMKNKTILPGS